MKSKSLGVAALALSVALLVPLEALANVNKSVRVDDGEQTGPLSSVNGSITVGDSAIVDGDVETTNGSIRIGDNVQFRTAETTNGRIRIGSGALTTSIDTVNGAISVGENARIDGSVETVNGGIKLSRGSTVGADVGTVNGSLDVSGTDVGGNLSTVMGSIEVTDGSIVRGDVVIRKSRSWGFNWGGKNRKPKVIIGPNSQVVGSIVADQEIELYISESATVGAVRGKASLEEAIRFSGDRP
ncbi:MAG: hypothetical protein AAGA61_01990 [Pseudomonadota bacterium]